VKLRAKLAWTVLAAAVPAVAGLAAFRSYDERRTVERALADYAFDRMASGGRQACESDPEHFPPPPLPLGPGPRGPNPRQRMPRDPLVVPEPRGPRDFRGVPDQRGEPPRDARGEPRNELWAYAPDFRSANPQAPPFPPALREELEDGVEIASSRWPPPSRAGLEVAVRMPWDGPAAIVLVRRREIGPPNATRDFLVGSALLCAVLLGAVVLAAGPVVERVRRLTAQVRRSADEKYVSGVHIEGSDEVAELSQAFDGAAREIRGNLEEIEKRERSLREFVENTTHDVMLPLTVLQGHLTVLRRRAEAGAPGEDAVVVDALQEAHYMASLIQNLSAAARLESGEPALEKHRIDLVALVERVVARHAPVARARGVALEHAVPSEPLATEGDVTLLEQAASNLVHNAVRYVESNGHVAVILERRGEEFTLRVLDDGPGIAPELRSRVFERAFRADSARSRHPGGLGLGLSIAKDVADRHGFALEIRAPAAGGAEIELRGPART
jgi:signal transduction histidine kinase